MKKLLLILLLLPCLLKAQVKTKLYVGGPLATNVYRGPVGSDSGLYMVSNCGDPNILIPKPNVGEFYNVYRGAMIYKDTCADEVWTSNPDSTWTPLANDYSFEIDTTFTLDGTILILTVPHGLATTPDYIAVNVDNELGLSTFVQPYADNTNIYIPYSIGPIGTFAYQIKIRP